MVTKSLILLLNYFYCIIYCKFQPQGNYSQTFIYVVTFIKTRFFQLKSYKIFKVYNIMI